jgi:hypothetical protein
MVRLISTLSLLVSLAGCAGRELSAAGCEWPPETAVSLDLKVPAQLRHLRDDAQAAELLAAIYADSRQGLDKFGERRQLAERCEATLFNAIARVHQVSLDQVRNALRRQNDLPF